MRVEDRHAADDRRDDLRRLVMPVARERVAIEDDEIRAAARGDRARVVEAHASRRVPRMGLERVARRDRLGLVEDAAVGDATGDGASHRGDRVGLDDRPVRAEGERGAVVEQRSEPEEAVEPLAPHRTLERPRVLHPMQRLHREHSAAHAEEIVVVHGLRVLDAGRDPRGRRVVREPFERIERSAERLVADRVDRRREPGVPDAFRPRVEMALERQFDEHAALAGAIGVVLEHAGGAQPERAVGKRLEADHAKRRGRAGGDDLARERVAERWIDRPVAIEDRRGDAKPERIGRVRSDGNERLANLRGVLHRAHRGDAVPEEMRRRLAHGEPLPPRIRRRHERNDLLPRVRLDEEAGRRAGGIAKDFATRERRKPRMGRLDQPERRVVEYARMAIHPPGDGRAVAGCGKPRSIGRPAAFIRPSLRRPAPCLEPGRPGRVLPRESRSALGDRLLERGAACRGREVDLPQREARHHQMDVGIDEGGRHDEVAKVEGLHRGAGMAEAGLDGSIVHASNARSFESHLRGARMGRLQGLETGDDLEGWVHQAVRRGERGGVM